jgi:hypothetical protein
MLRIHVTVCRLCLAVLLVSTLGTCGSAATPAAPGQPGMGLNITSGPCPLGAVQAGDAVVWTNADQADHQIRGVRDGVVIFDSGILKPGDTFAFLFPDEGQFPYTCSIDGSLTGTITVEP